MLCALLIDDEAHNRDTLRKLLERHCPHVSVEGEAVSVSEGIGAIRTLKPDLVFLDINMKDGTGFDLLQSLGPPDFRIILISAFDKNTLMEVKRSGMLFLTKPINPIELIAAVNHAENAGTHNFL